MYIDSHAHLEVDRFDADREAVIERARQGGVDMMLTVGQVEPDWNGMRASLALAEAHPFIVTSVGLHPHDARHFDAETGARMLEASRHPKVVAWGECGLDFYYDNSPRDQQRSAFREQLRLAREAKLPVIIHSRDAAEETLEILADEWQGSLAAGVYHCFSYDVAVARAAVDLGMFVSFSGIITFKTAEAIKEAAAELPLDSILIETDSPFLAPVPYRGKRNEPVYVTEVAAEIARLRGVTREEIGRRTAENFRRLFRLEAGAR
jgi:TatD DNase family protein